MQVICEPWGSGSLAQIGRAIDRWAGVGGMGGTQGRELRLNWGREPDPMAHPIAQTETQFPTLWLQHHPTFYTKNKLIIPHIWFKYEEIWQS